MNIITRRGFLSKSFQASAAVALATLTDIPFVMKRALAEGTIGMNNKKLLFIFLRGGMDGLNTIVPTGDTSYNDVTRPNIYIPPAAGVDYSATGPCDFPQSSGTAGPTYDTFHFLKALRLGNGFASLHP